MKECCDKIVESITTAPTTSGGTCGEGGTNGETLDRVNNLPGAALARELHAGTYVVPRRRFVYNCSGCIKSIQLAVSTTSVLRNAQGQERITFHTFANKTGNASVFQRTESPNSWTSSVVMTTSNGQVVEYRPSTGSAEVCFSQGDAFGFTIEAESGITLITRFGDDTEDLVLNATSSLPMSISGCPQLYTTGPSSNVIPLIHIVTGKFPFSLTCSYYIHYLSYDRAQSSY